MIFVPVKTDDQVEVSLCRRLWVVVHVVDVIDVAAVELLDILEVRGGAELFSQALVAAVAILNRTRW